MNPPILTDLQQVGFSRRIRTVATCFVVTVSCGSAFAANGTWVGNQSNANADWSNAANWSGSTIAGSVGTTNTDTMTINNAVSGLNTKGIASPILIDVGRNIRNISFTSDRGGGGVTTTGAFSGTTGYTIGLSAGPALTLNDGGYIAIHSNFIGTGITEAVNAPLTLSGNYSFVTATLPSQNNLLSFGGTISRAAAGASVLSLRGMGNGQITGNIVNGTGTVGLVQYATGTWTLSGANSFSDGVAVRSGSMVLDHTSNNAAKISGALNLGRTAASNAQGAGGALSIVGNASAATTETVSTTTVGAGANSVSVVTGLDQNASIDLGTITRARAGTMNFSTTNTGTGVARILGSYAGSANGIMGGWAVKNGQDWATLSGGEVIAYSAYANDTWSAGTNTNVTQSGAVTSGTTNSLRFNTAAPITLTLSGTNTLQSGGILVGSGTGSNDVTITGGTITNSNNAELILNQYNTGGVLAVLSDIALTGTNRTLVKTGEGTVVLGGNNSIGVSGNTGLVAIESGTLRLGSSTALNSAFTDLQLGSITSQLDLNGYNGAVAALYSNNFEGKGITAAAQAAPKISNLAAGTSSTLTIQNGGTYTGSFGEASGAILNLAVTSGTFNINAPSNLSGYGDVITSLPSNMFELITGSITLSGANTTLSVSKDLNIWGALNLNGASTRVTVGQPMGVSYLSGTGVVNAGNPLSVNHIGSAADTFSGTFLANAYNKIYVGGTGTLVLPAITTSVASTSGSGSSLRLSGAATVITPGLTTSGAGSNWSVRVGGESTLKVTGTSGVVIGTSVATNVTGLSDTNAGLTGGTLWVAPSGSGQNITVSGLTALGDATTGAAMFYQNGSTLILDRGQNQSLTFTLGNVGNTFVRNGLQRLTGGTVVIAATDGLSRTGSNGLGTSERLVILGSGAALPTVTNGMVSASLVGQDNDVNKSGDFLTYEGTGISTDAGYRAYDYSGANGLDNTLVGANYTKVAKLTSNQSITSGTTGLYALRIDNSTLSISSGASLRLGDAASTLGGLILNGGTIDGDGSLLIPTGANGELAIYTSLAGGTINATISGGGTSQSGGLTKFGEGTLLVTKAMTYTFGFTSLNEGVLDLNGFALPSNTALRLQGGVLQSRGSFINGLSSANGGVLINGGGFAARGGAYDISIGGVANPTKFTWGDAGSNNINGVLIFGSTTADNTVTLRNAIDLGTGNRNGYLNNYSSESMRVVRVVDNVNSSTDRAVLSGIISSSSPYQGLAKDGNGELYLTAANTYTGPTAVTAGKLWISADNNLGDDPDAAYAIDGTPTPGAVIINGGATLGLYNTFTLSSTRNLLLASGATGATASRIEVTANQTVTFGGKIGNYIGEVGSLDKTGAGSLILNGVSQYTGTTKVSAGTLVVNGSITSSSGVEVAAGASLGGRGSVGAISGAGLIGPGNSPGILTGTNVNASAGLDFAFEFTLANAAPNYGSASSPGNDVLRLTSATPFVASLNSGNEVAIYLNLGSLNEGDVVYGGFYADSGDFFGSISGAKFTYYLADAGGAFSYGGVNYSLYTANEIQASTVAQTANFGQGDINGYVMQLEVVPEPSTWLLVGMGLFSVLIFRRRLVRRGN